MAAATAITNMTPAQKAFLLYVGEGIIGLTGLLLVSSKTLGIAATMIQVYGDVGKVLAGQTIRNRALQYAVLGVQRGFQTMSAGGAKGGTPINVYITGATINNGGDIKKIAYEVAKEIDYQVEKRAINMNVGAI